MTHTRLRLCDRPTYNTMQQLGGDYAYKSLNLLWSSTPTAYDHV